MSDISREGRHFGIAVNASAAELQAFTYLSHGTFDWSSAIVNRCFGPVLRDEHCVVREPDNNALAHRAHRGILDRLARLFVDDAEDLVEPASLGLLLLPSRQGLGNGIQKRDEAADVGRNDRIPDARERHAQPLALSSEFLLGALAAGDVLNDDVVGRYQERSGDESGDEESEEDVSAAGLCLRGPLREQNVLLRLHFIDVPAQIIHEPLADAGRDKLPRRFQASALPQGDSGLKAVEPGGDREWESAFVDWDCPMSAD